MSKKYIFLSEVITYEGTKINTGGILFFHACVTLKFREKQSAAENFSTAITTLPGEAGRDEIQASV